MNKSFIKGAGIIMLGSIIGQGIMFISYPIISNLYSPSDFGIYSVLLSTVSIISIIASFRYELAIPQKKYKKLAFAYIDICVFLSFLVSLSIIMLVPFLYGFLEYRFEFYMFCALAVLFSSIGLSLTYECIRTKNFYTLGKNRVQQSLVTVISQVSLSFIGWRGLIIGLISSHIISTLYLSNRLKYKIGWFGWSKYIRLIRKEADFPKFSLPSALFNSMSNNLPLVFFTMYYGVLEGGLFAIAIKLTLAPSSILGQAFSKVIHSSLANAKNQHDIREQVVKFTFLLISISVLVFYNYFVWIDVIIKSFFNDEWFGSVSYIHAILTWAIFQFIASPLSSYFFITKNQKLELYIQVCISSVKIVLAPLIFSLVSSPSMGVLYYSIMSSITYALFVLVIVYHANIFFDFIVVIIKVAIFLLLLFFLTFEFLDEKLILSMFSLMMLVPFFLMINKRKI
ncbi:TPA: lipopolysaccharide biosynthesis protein [Vibrio diabolicus]